MIFLEESLTRGASFTDRRSVRGALRVRLSFEKNHKSVAVACHSKEQWRTSANAGSQAGNWEAQVWHDWHQWMEARNWDGFKRKRTWVSTMTKALGYEDDDMPEDKDKDKDKGEGGGAKS